MSILNNKKDKLTKGEIAYFLALKYTSIIALAISAPLIIIGLFIKDYTMLFVTTALIATSSIGYFITVKYDKSFTVRVLYLVIHGIIIYASTTHMVIYPLILMYPLGLILTVFTWSKENRPIIYAILCSIGIVIYVIKLVAYLHLPNYWLHVSIGVIIGVGLILSIFYIAKQGLELIREYQAGLEAKQLELHKNNEKLKQYIESNIQLEKFASIASHDLRAPLITINSFSTLLQKRLMNTTLSDLDQKSLKYLETSSEHLLNLVDDLLEYSNVNSQNLKLKTVDTNKVLNTVIKIYCNTTLDTCNINVLNTFPIITCDEIKLKRVFQNLIGNAIKFKKSDAEATITIWSREDDLNWFFHVKDNGIGMDTTNVNIFDLHTRLNNKAEFPGAGMGLAISQKIIIQHGGDIQYNSHLNVGSEFYFNIPKMIPEAE